MLEVQRILKEMQKDGRQKEILEEIRLVEERILQAEIELAKKKIPEKERMLEAERIIEEILEVQRILKEMQKDGRQKEILEEIRLVELEEIRLVENDIVQIDATSAKFLKNGQK